MTDVSHEEQALERCLAWLMSRVRMREFERLVGKKDASRAATALIAMWLDSLTQARAVTPSDKPVRLNDLLLPVMRPVDVFGKENADDERHGWDDIFVIGLEELVSVAHVHLLVHAITDGVRAEVVKAAMAGILLYEGLILRQDPVTGYYTIAPVAS